MPAAGSAALTSACSSWASSCGDAFQSFRDRGLNLSGASLLRREQRALELRGALLEGGALLRRILELTFEHRDAGCGTGRGFGPLRVTCL